MYDRLLLKGTYFIKCFDPNGSLLWDDVAHNSVVTVGKNFALDTLLAGSGYTVTGPYMGLISGTAFSAIAAADTMTSHAGWIEAGGTNGPFYGTNRGSPVWASAAGGIKSLSTPLTFSMTGNGVLQGLFMVYGAGASSTKDNTGGTLFSAGVFQSGAQSVNSGNNLQISYSISI